jgi:3-carboxy-cis,cis-muconate cycloisomerase
MAAHPLAFPLLQALVGDNEIAGFFSNESEISALLQVEAALAEAEAEVGLIEKEAARRIAEVCDGFQPDWKSLEQGLARDGVVVPDLVKQLRSVVGETHAKALHLGATSQDIVDTALMLRLKSVAEVLLLRLDALLQGLARSEVRDGTIPLMAHTRMQRARAFTVADKLETWVRPLERHQEALRQLMPHLLVIQLGGPIGTREGFEGQGDAVAEAMAKRLGLGSAPPWHSQRDRIGAFASWLSLVSGTLGKIGQDIALMAQNELDEIRLSSSGGSSSMPHKSNPVQAEVLVALARFNAGLLSIVHQALVHENERSGSAWTLEWLVLPQMVVSTAAGLTKACSVLGGSAEFVAFSPSREELSDKIFRPGEA